MLDELTDVETVASQTASGRTFDKAVASRSSFSSSRAVALRYLQLGRKPANDILCRPLWALACGIEAAPDRLDFGDDEVAATDHCVKHSASTLKAGRHDGRAQNAAEKGGSAVGNLMLDCYPKVRRELGIRRKRRPVLHDDILDQLRYTALLTCPI